MILQQGAGYGVTFVEDALHLKIDGGGHRYAAGLVRAWGQHSECMLASGCELAVEREIATLVGDQGATLRRVIDALHVQASAATIGAVIGEDHTYLLAHAPACDHVAGDVGYDLQVVLSAGGDMVGSKGQFFGSASPKAYGDTRHEGLAAVVVAVFFGSELRDAEALAARQDGDAIDGIGFWQVISDEGVPSFMIGDDAPFAFAHHNGAQRAQLNTGQRILEALVVHMLQVAPGRA